MFVLFLSHNNIIFLRNYNAMYMQYNAQYKCNGGIAALANFRLY